MEVSNNVVARPPHKSAKRGALIGTIGGAAVSATTIGLAGVALKSLGSAQTFGQKKELIKAFTDSFVKTGVDMSKTTVSRVAKQGLKSLKNPTTVLTTVLIGTVFGMGIGAIVDMFKNKKAKRAQEAKEL